LGAFFAPQKTGLSACIFFACGKKGYRFYPLRCPETASMPFLGCKFFASQKTYETIVAGLLPACGFGFAEFCFAKLQEHFLRLGFSAGKGGIPLSLLSGY
jgi:hypothetical protein